MKLTNGCSERAQGALNHSSVRSNAASCLLSTTTRPCALQDLITEGGARRRTVGGTHKSTHGDLGQAMH